MNVISEVEKYRDIIPIIATPEYLKTFNNVVTFGYFIEDNYLLAYCIRKKVFVNYILLTSPIVSISNVHLEQENIFLNNVITFIKRKLPVVDFIITDNTTSFVNYPTGAEFCKFGSYVVDLMHDEDTLFSKIHSKHRNVIRKAEKDGLIVDHGQIYADVCYEIIKNTYLRQNKEAYAKEYFNRFKLMGSNVDYWVVKFGNTIQGCAILLWSRGGSSYYLHGGSIEGTHAGAMNYLHWLAMLTMKKRGVRYYDFVGARINPDKGSKLEGIQRFKMRFGGEFKESYFWRYIFHPLKYKLYNSMVNLYLTLKGRKLVEDVIKAERKKGNF